MSFIQTNFYNKIDPSPLQVIRHPQLSTANITVSIKRDDLLHPDISGNKWRKLKYNILEAKKRNIKHLISFGGAFSNHIHALSAAGYHFNFATTGIIRGETHYASNPTLSQAQRWGMKLQFVDRKTYREKESSDYLHRLKAQYPDAYIIPEGGSNHLAIPGVEEVVTELLQQSTKPIDHIFTATGSAGTLSGLISGALKLTNKTQVHGIAVLKNAHYLTEVLTNFVPKFNDLNWHLHTEFHGGGYGKVSAELAHFCHQFTQETQIPIEPIYTGKMLYALWQLIDQGYFSPGSHIVAIHTGGLQGLAGLKQQKKI
ncbi:pyridoxal-phosphate dependent enzyme [Psychromonas sp.]|nr:pyridoxal-phosphate dependent enzyme [Psychromonas sp.]